MSRLTLTTSSYEGFGASEHRGAGVALVFDPLSGDYVRFTSGAAGIKAERVGSPLALLTSDPQPEGCEPGAGPGLAEQGALLENTSFHRDGSRNQPHLNGPRK